MGADGRLGGLAGGADGAGADELTMLPALLETVKEEPEVAPSTPAPGVLMVSGASELPGRLRVISPTKLDPGSGCKATEVSPPAETLPTTVVPRMPMDMAGVATLAAPGADLAMSPDTKEKAPCATRMDSDPVLVAGS